jgi:hypothetical protein
MPTPGIGVANPMDYQGDNRRARRAHGPKVVAHEEVEREQDRYDRASDIDRQNSARPIDGDWAKNGTPKSSTTSRDTTCCSGSRTNGRLM